MAILDPPFSILDCGEVIAFRQIQFLAASPSDFASRPAAKLF